MNKSKATTTLLALGCALTLALTACGTSSGSTASGGSNGGTSSNGNSNKLSTIQIAVSHPTDIYIIPWLAAQDQGFLQKHGVKITKIVAGKGGTTTLRDVLQGGLAMGEVGYTAIPKGYVTGGAKVEVVGGAVQSLYNVRFYTLSSNKNINSLKDVKTWAFTNPGSVTQSLTFLIPQVAGINPSSIKRVAAGGLGEGIALLEAHKVDIAVVPPSVALKNPGKFKLVVDPTKYLKGFQQSAIVTSPNYAKSNPNVVRGVLAAYQEGVKWVESHPNKAGELYAKQAKVSPKIGTQIVKGASAVNSWDVGFNPSALKNAAKALKATNFKHAVPYCKMFNANYLPQGASKSLPVPNCPKQ